MEKDKKRVKKKKKKKKKFLSRGSKEAFIGLLILIVFFIMVNMIWGCI